MKLLRRWVKDILIAVDKIFAGITRRAVRLR